MSEPNQLAQQMQQDLNFVRTAVEAKQRPSRSTGPLPVWAAYTLICIPAYDYLPRHYAVGLNLAGWILAAAISFWLGQREVQRTGQFDRSAIARSALHWYGGILLMFVAIFGLANGHTGLTETGAGQVSVVLVGFLYFTAGVHTVEQRYMRIAGPVIILAGIGMGWLPHLQWTAMGLIFAACLLSPIIFGNRKSKSSEQA
jgi:hypothetical protein